MVHNDYKYKVNLVSYKMSEGLQLQKNADMVGPNSTQNQFGMLRDYFPITDEDGNLGYMYQDFKTWEVLLTFFGPGGIKKTLNYESVPNYHLGAAISGKKGELFYLLI